MATFAAHTALGAGVCAAPAHLLGAPTEAVVALTVYGAVLGSLPDTFDWVMAKLGLAQRWFWYVKLHHDPPWWLMIQPPFALHLWTDEWFHDPMKPGWDWWPERGWLEILIWVVSGLLLWYGFS